MEAMMRGKLITGGAFVVLALGIGSVRADLQTLPPNPTVDPSGGGQAVASFKAGVDLVRIAAVVRDRKGRFVQDLRARDFEVLDEGRTRAISDLQNDISAVSVAVLFDVSGSMEGRLRHAREAAAHVLSWLDASKDEVAVFTFD